MKRVLTTTWLLVALAFLWLIIWCWVAATSSEPHWVQRAGSVVVVIGVVIAARPIFRLGYRKWLQSLRVADYGHIMPGPEELEEDRQRGVDEIAQKIVGPIVALVGTLIWGYGDLAWTWVFGM